MKPQILALAFVAISVAISAGCIDPGGDEPVTYDHQGPRPGPVARCGQLTTCGACTPVLGCGWCWSGDKGLCASQPNDCASAMSFDWTWESSGCPTGPAASSGDAGTSLDARTSSEAGTDVATSSDAAANDGGADARDDGSDAGAPG